MKNYSILFGPFLFALLVSSYTIEGIFPNAGPTTGETRVTIYSPTFQGMNYSDHPTPKCQFSDSVVQAATWIHCIGSASNPTSDKSATCLNCESSAHAAGNFSIKVSLSGNFDDTAEVGFLFYQQATVDFISPPLGSKRGGTFVQVHGQNFKDLPGLSCGFGTITVPATYVSPTMLTCQSPAADVTDTPIPLRVTLNGQQYSDARENFYYHGVPEISQLIPNQGSTSGGTEVYILGKQLYPFENSNISFTDTTFVRFGTDNYVKPQLINRTHCKVVSPPSISATPVPVELSFNDQEWTKNGIMFNYYISPYVIRLNPNIGAGIGGTNITVIGANFYNSSEIKCRFGANVVDGHYINDSSIWCIAPPGETDLVDFGLSIEQDHFSSNPINYQYVRQPSIDGISPQCGPTSGETQIAVTGKNFISTGVNQVFCIFGEFRQPGTIINDTLIFCDSPTLADRFGNNIFNITSFPFQLTLNSLEVIDSDFTFNYYTMPNILSINPKIGPIEGGTEITITVDNLNDTCGILCRFSTYEVEGILSKEKNQLTCLAPAVPCPGQSLVQITLNGQQYSTNDHTAEGTLFTHYKPPIVAYALPTSFPTSGNSSIGVYGSGFLLSKNSTTLANGESRMSYQCRFKDSKGKVLGLTTSTYFSDYYVHCKTPQLDTPTNNVSMEVSPNGQSWIPIPNENINFYDSPAVTAVEPAFGKVKQTNATLVVRGRNFDCEETNCQYVKCAFSGSNFRIVTDGARQSAEVVYCPIPSISRPEMTQVQVSMNGVDFTPQQVNYTFYDAFVVNVDPGFIPVEGNVPVKVIGFGFADTPELKVRLEDARDGSVLTCAGGKSCVLPAKFESPTEITFTAPTQGEIKTTNGDPLGFQPFNVEVSVYGDSFTSDKVGLNYYQQPEVGANLAVSGEPSFEFHQNAMGAIFIPINLQIPGGVRPEDFLRRTRTLCKYIVGGEEAITEGKLVQYPYPAAANLDLSQLSIECPTPRLGTSGDGKVSVSLNGVNFVGNLALRVLPQLNIEAISPRCGPAEGGTRVDVNVAGIQQSEVSSFFFSWSSVCTDFFNPNVFAKGTISTVSPPAPFLNTNGGYSSLSFSTMEATNFVDTALTQQRTRNHFESYLDFLYYRKPIITKIYPHGGINTGGTPISIEGAFFFEDPRTGCTPKCKFGDEIVDAQFISTVRLICNSPPGKLGAFVPLTVTFNGQDEAEAIEPQSFTYIGKPNVKTISPGLGPATGGTMLTVTGRGFVDMSRYPEEFACIFKPVNGLETPKIVPATYLNSTAIACPTPGGWQPGSDAEVEISFNGIDFSSDGVRFKFYQIDKVWPLSGPSIGGSRTTIIGTGLVPNIQRGKPACKINNIVVNADIVRSTQIGCVIPPATDGPTFRGRVDFYYTLDGEEWEQAVQGFNYYPQADVSQVIPKFISANGGQLKVKGNNFNTNFPGSSLTCKINNTTVTGQYVNETELNCPFRTIAFNPQEDAYLQVSLNGDSYTDRSEITKVNIFKVSEIIPQSGVIEGGTQLIVNGVNFPQGSIPVCKFGVPGMSSVSYGTLVSDKQITCAAPPAQINKISGTPFMVPFTIAFDNDQYDTFDRAGLHYYYYAQPEVTDITPAQAPVDQSVLVTLTSSDQKPFNASIIGSTLTQQNSYLELDIICKFGRFGTTPGALLAGNQIGCPSPNRIDATNVTQEVIQVEVALNGQDFTVVPKPFTFVGTQQVSSSTKGFAWFMPIVTAGVALAFVLYITSRRFPPHPNKEKVPLVAHNVQKSDDTNIQENIKTKIIT